MMSGRNLSSWVADSLAEEEERPREEEFARRVRAHESVKEDWTERFDDRPEDIRPAVWHDPLYEPSNPTEKEARFIKTRHIRRRVLEWTGDLP